MGTWDIGFFDNDMACDWENGAKNDNSLLYIESALDPVLLNSDENLDIDLANKALAAAETLARLLGNTGESNSYTKHIDNWVATFNGDIPQNLIDKAKKIVSKVLNPDSELRQYWALRGELDAWSNQLKELEERLK